MDAEVSQVAYPHFSDKLMIGVARSLSNPEPLLVNRNTYQLNVSAATVQYMGSFLFFILPFEMRALDL